MRTSSAHIACLLCLFCSIATGQVATFGPTDAAGFEFLPGAPIVPPLIANHQEPRVGVRIEIGTNRLKLDIGSSLDMLGYSFDGERKKQLRFGADFFTYALTTNFQDHRLQVDAVDGFFGGHIVYRTDEERSALVLRLRILHLSAHMVDGHFDNEAGTWRDGREPIPFTRDFGELLATYSFPAGAVSIMPYIGTSYATLVRPSDMKRWGGLCGVEMNSGDAFGKVFGKPFELYLADNFTLAGIPAWVGTNIFEVGTKFGSWEGSGIRLYLNYASGMELFSQYYNVRNSKWGIGFAFDVR
jgi:hypothetical protein